MFAREQYYSQTEVVKTFKVSVKALKTLLDRHQIPVVQKDVDLGDFKVKTAYVLKSDIAKLNLLIRKANLET